MNVVHECSTDELWKMTCSGRSLVGSVLAY